MFSCQFDGHQANQILGICLNENCEVYPFFCPQCLINNLHSSHSKTHCFQFDQIKTLLLDRTNIISKFTQLIENLCPQLSIDLKKIEKYNFDDRISKETFQKINKIYQKIKCLVDVSKKILEKRKTISESLFLKNYEVVKQKVQHVKFIHFQTYNKIILYNDQANVLADRNRQKIQNLIDKFFKKENILFDRSLLLQSQQFQEAINISSKLLQLRPSEAKNLIQFKKEKYYFIWNHMIKLFNILIRRLIWINFIRVSTIQKVKKSFFNIGIALLKLDDLQYAIFNFDNELKQNPFFHEIIDLLMKKGMALQKLRLYDEAIECYDQIIQQDQNYTEAYFAKAVALQNKGEYLLAVSVYDIVLDYLPNDSEAKFNRGCALIELERFDEAVQYFQEIQISDPQFIKIAEVTFNQGIALCRLNQIQEAISTFLIVFEYDPDNLDLLYKSGQTLLLMNEFKEARKVFQRFLGLSENHLEGNLNMGIILYNLKIYEGAAIHLRKVLYKDNFNQEALKYQGLCLLKQNKYDNSILSFDQMLNINQNNIEAQFYKGKILYKMKNYDQAVKSFDNIISSNPNYENSIYFKGKSLRQIENYSDAIQCFYKVLLLNPNNLKAKKQLNQTLEEQGLIALD